MNNELYHHGVKGMKWGVRKDRETGGVDTRKLAGPVLNAYKPLIKKANAAPKPDLSRQKAIANNFITSSKKATEEGQEKIAFEKEHSRKSIYKEGKSLSDAELKQRVDRMQLEKRFRDLMYEEASAGRSYLENKFRSFGDNTLDELSKKGSRDIAKKALG